jgi:hypothetical protein
MGSSLVAIYFESHKSFYNLPLNIHHKIAPTLVSFMGILIGKVNL